MRINPNVSNPIQNNSTAAADSAKKSEGAKKNPYAQGAGERAALKNESVNSSISGKAREMSQIKKLAEDAPDVREAKIAELKAKIQNKTYDVSAEAIADRLVDDHMGLVGA